ncbi:PR5-like receptor kinase [Salvia hispanica]|uniref:PR5-like receptor kinase n=1 Tax=Salvia hispanica TaxID=49212 RepID=UPI0020098834|nr:PR5-like receptor kinase [Salvia hispanica]
MRLSDISPDSNICSFPIRPSFDYSSNCPFNCENSFVYKLISLVSCKHPLHNSSLFTQLTDCEQYSKYTYIHVGNMRVQDMESMCTLKSLLATSNWTYPAPEYMNNVSLPEIHQYLVYGFNLNWYELMCRYGQEGIGPDQLVSCDHSELQHKWDGIKETFLSSKGPIGGYLMILLLIIAIVFGGITIPAKIIITIGLVTFFFLLKQQPIGSPMLYPLVISPVLEPLLISQRGKIHRGVSLRNVVPYLQIPKKAFVSIRGYSGLPTKRQPSLSSKLRSGHYVAVKLLGKATVNGQDFINEIGTIGRIHHVNVVQLVGCCADRSKRALILDFMPNGSLDKYIFNQDKASSLDWGIKYKIAIGVARGIKYLHSGCDIKILHFDIKPHNILLDDQFVPKITDFELAKLYSVDKDTVTMTAARGTIGYVAPELNCRSIGLVSHKDDVYSFGMLLMEMAGVNRVLKGNKYDSTKYFPDWIYDCINKGVGIGIVEEENNNVDDKNEIGKSVLKKMTIIGLWCIQMNSENRPSMNEVLEMLEGDVEDLKIPEHPSHLVNEDKSRAADSASFVSQLDYDNGSIIEISIA